MYNNVISLLFFKVSQPQPQL